MRSRREKRVRHPIPELIYLGELTREIKAEGSVFAVPRRKQQIAAFPMPIISPMPHHPRNLSSTHRRTSLFCFAFAGVQFLALGLDSCAKAAVTYQGVFAPQNPIVSSYEMPAHQELCLNGQWKFEASTDTSIPTDATERKGDWEKTPIKIPSPWNVNGFSMHENEHGGDYRAYPSYPADWENVNAAWMEKTIKVPATWNGSRIVLRFGAVAGKFVAFVNGNQVGGGFDIFFAHEFDVTKWIKPGEDNTILVKVVRPSVFKKPGPYGDREYVSGSMWGTYIAGIWQDVYLLAQPQISVSDVFVQPYVSRDDLTVETTVANNGNTSIDATVGGDVHEWQPTVKPPEVGWRLASPVNVSLDAAQVTVPAGETRTVTLHAKVAGRLKLWSPNEPNLYGLLTRLAVNGKSVDVKYTRFGWREFSFDGSKFLLNGQQITMKGDSGHFMGIPQMTRRYPWAWYTMLKDAGENAIRLHATVYPEFYEELADEMGVLILDESAVWFSDGGPKGDSDLYWANARDHVQKLVLRDRDHPCVYGWSVCNEVTPVMRNVWKMPPELTDRGIKEIVGFVDICRKNDPTHSWISGDGEDDIDGKLPVFNDHYGDENKLRNAMTKGKPVAVGETGMSYFATPKQVAPLNGNRAYESQLGRMEGIAIEDYGLLTMQDRLGLNYHSVFNTFWYSLEPLRLGLADIGRPYTLDDGIFFRNYHEGQIGVQPERLGPYCSTFNPGYDPSLPLYKPWPSFYAIQAANLGKPWQPVVAPAEPTAPAPVDPVSTLFYLPANGKGLVDELARAGAVTAPLTSGTTASELALDGSSAATLDDQTVATAQSVLRGGGTVWIWNVTQDSSPQVSRLLGEKVVAEPREASSFLVASADPLAAGLNAPNLYFSENDDWHQMSYGLAGDFVKAGKTVIEACPTDWRVWNNVAETVKTTAVLRSERERHGSRVAIVDRNVGGGRVILCNLSPKVESNSKQTVLSLLLRNGGVKIHDITEGAAFVDFDWRLRKALVCGAIPISDMTRAYGSPLPEGTVADGADFAGQKWKVGQVAGDSMFDFRSLGLDGPMENAAAYVSIWIRSPKPLNDLLAEPNLPKLSFIYGSDDGCEVWLNGNRIASHERTGPIDPAAFTENPLLLKLGWNQLIIKVVQVQGEWKFAGKFDCDQRDFLSNLEFATKPPSENGGN